jgi:hypothetical protein
MCGFGRQPDFDAEHIKNPLSMHWKPALPNIRSAGIRCGKPSQKNWRLITASVIAPPKSS